MSNVDYSPPSEQTHFLVSGGGKGITAINAIALAKAYRSRFTLVGRSELIVEEQSWAHELSDEASLKKAALDHQIGEGLKPTPKEIDRVVAGILSSREIDHTLQAIADAGGRAEYIQADITDEKDLYDKLSELLPGINAVLHGAGALADKYIHDKLEKDFDLVYGVKVGGLKNLLSLTPPNQLDYLVLFSSVAGFYGNAGQADYSLSNEILNKLAHHLKHTHPDCQVLSIGWGPWDGGMVTPQLKRILVRRNVPLISPGEGTEILVDLLNDPQDNPQFVVGEPLPFPPKPLDEGLQSYRIARNLTIENNPFLGDHVIGGNAVLPTVCAVSWFINSCESLKPGYQFFSIRNYQVFKGIVFDEGSPRDYYLELNEIEKSAEAMIYAGKISSETQDGNIRFHYQAEVELRKELPDRPKVSRLDLREESSISGQSLYKSNILFHGPIFQGIQKVLNISSEGLVTECLLPGIPLKKMGQFPVRNFNPFLADVHLQSLLIWANANLGSIGLPLQIGEGTQYCPIGFGDISYATMIVKNVTSHKLVADVISHDHDGYIYSEVRDAEITLNDKLFDLFKENQLGVEPAWI